MEKCKSLLFYFSKGVVFSILYGIISFTFAYYGEMITYLGMTAPMAVFAFLSWLRNPYEGNRAEVKVNRLKEKEPVFMLALKIGRASCREIV